MTSTRGLQLMRKTQIDRSSQAIAPTPTIPSKTELLEIVAQDTSRGGFQLEWMLDRCADRAEGKQ